MQMWRPPGRKPPSRRRLRAAKRNKPQRYYGTRYYTDAGYGEAGKTYEAHHDVEAFARFSHNAAGDLILSFNSQPRGTYRFDILAHPLDYVLEYTLGNGSGFGFSCAQRHLRPPQGERVFSA